MSFDLLSGLRSAGLQGETAMPAPRPPARSGMAAGDAAKIPARLGTLVVSAPGRQLRYAFTADDALWTARFLVGEAGGRDDAANRAVIWAMLNRYALFTRKYYKTFHAFLRAYSTPLQPVLRSWGAARRHMDKPAFVRTGGVYKPPHDNIPKGQLRQFLSLQKRPWAKLPLPARTLALAALGGSLPNPIGNASEFGSTYVYFHDRHRRYPSDAEWRAFTEAYARGKAWRWIGPVAGLDQKRNAFFVQAKVARLPAGAVRVEPASASMAEAMREQAMVFEGEDDCPDCLEAEFTPDMEEEFRLGAYPSTVLDAFRQRNRAEVIRRAAQQGRSAEDIANLLFYMAHPERIDASGAGRPLEKGEPGYAKLVKEWKALYLTVPGPHPEVNTLMAKQGVGFYCRKDAAMRWGVPEMVMALTTVAARWFVRFPHGPRIVISDLSKRGGGWLSPHKSHQVGLDVDIGLVRNDGKEGGAVTYKTGNYSRERTRHLVESILANGVLPVKTLAFNDPAIQHPKVVRWSGHDDHLHVRFCVPAHYKALRQRIPSAQNYRC
ncbi:penicillin-insensitive murein endopeptidase [Cupriavidus respiraculi]|uniref:penicillin-insensitive murein endopeptidase n=1 Tax=Cupriavidus respiraculi TaxID=195930 RepID=UPI001C98CD53|nr:penicillin-insensitive murein endopeptidase [Cupriavidus respiraculi]MBY4949719.1 penicillin-insensitive murein endopeptidase [Cupriavidus respiraculi]